MTCLICRRAQLVQGMTDVTLQRNDRKIVVKSVPARICPGCGEAYVEEHVAVRLLNDAERVSKKGEHENQIEFGD